MTRFFIGISLMLFTLSCCREPAPPIDEPNLYKWNIPDITDFPFLNHLYEDGFYYLNSVNPQNGDQFFMKIDERNGKVMYKTQLVSGGELPSTLASGHYFFDGKVIFIWDRYIFHLHKTSGVIIHIDTFPNYIYDHHFFPDFFTGSSYADGFTRYRFYEFEYDGNRFRQRDIHNEYFTHKPGKIDGGIAPIKTANGWVMAYAIQDESSQIIYIDNGQIHRYEVPVTEPLGWNLSTSFATKDYAFFSSFYDLYKVDRKDPSRYEILKITNGYNNFLEYNDHIYYIPAATQTPQPLVKLNPRTNEVTKFEIGSAFQYIPIIVKDILCYPLGSDFRKFHLKTETWIPPREDEFISLGYNVAFGASEKSKLLYNRNGYYCYPF